MRLFSIFFHGSDTNYVTIRGDSKPYKEFYHRVKEHVEFGAVLL